MNAKDDKVYQRIAARVDDWANRLAGGETSVDGVVGVVEEITDWVARSPHLLFTFVVAAVDSLAGEMEAMVTSRVSPRQVISVSWRTALPPDDPDILAMIQAVTARASKDYSQSRQVLINRNLAGGPQALLGIAVCAVATLANLRRDGPNALRAAEAPE